MKHSQLTTHYLLIIIWLFISTSVLGQTPIDYNATINDINGNPIFYYYEINTDECWDYDTAYFVTCDIVIKNGATLTIKPKNNTTKGVNIYFYPNTYLVIDNGHIQANGDANRKLKFTSAIKISNWMWKGFIFGKTKAGILKNKLPLYSTPNSMNSELNYCIIEYVEKTTLASCGPGEAYDGAIFINDFNNIAIKNSIIRNNIISKRGGGIFVGVSSVSNLLSGYPIIENNEIYNNTATRGGGICIFRLLPTVFQAYANIKDNYIHHNEAKDSGGGIAVLLNSNADITGNTISNNIAKSFHKVNIPNTYTTSPPPVSGGGGIAIGQGSEAFISSNNIYNNTSVLFDCPPMVNNIDVITGLGGGILIKMGSNATLVENNIYDNNAHDGGGIALYNGFYNNTGGPSSALCTNNIIESNNSGNEGGGIYSYHSYSSFIRNQINYNEATYGGGVFINTISDDNQGYSYTPILFENNEISFNLANIGGAFIGKGELLVQSGIKTEINFINNLVHNNYVEDYAPGILLNSNLIANFNNNTVCKNHTSVSSDKDNGSGIYIYETATNNLFSFVNNIIYYNGSNPASCQVFHQTIQPSEFLFNNIENLGCQVPISNNNIDFFPMFIDLTNNDFHLDVISPLIDIGESNVTPFAISDFDNKPRFVNDIDIGAYELIGSAPRKGNPKYSVSNIEFNIYPNPANKYLYVSPNDNTKVFSYSVLSFDGVKHLNSTNNNQSKLITIDISELTGGLYLVIFETSKGIIYKKFIKD